MTLIRRRVAQVVCVGLAAVGLLLPLPATLVERWYSTGVYPLLQRVVTPVTNLLPLAVFDLLLVTVVIWTLVVLGQGSRLALRSRRVGPATGALWRLVVAGAVVYLVFLALWGLNYRRVPLADRLEVAAGAPAPGVVVALGYEVASQLNALHAEAHGTGWPATPWQTAPLREGFAEVQILLGARRPAVPGRLKPTLLGPYFRWTGVDGMVNPFALETLESPGLLPFERPFVAAHEWAHLAGYADEAEASFVGWLTCLRGGVPAAYSGWLALFTQVLAEVGRERETELADALENGPRSDIAAIANRQRSAQVPALRLVGWSIYDRFLRANRVEEGIRRYGAFVTLVTQARFDDGWTPVQRID